MRKQKTKTWVACWKDAFTFHKTRACSGYWPYRVLKKYGGDDGKEDQKFGEEKGTVFLPLLLNEDKKIDLIKNSRIEDDDHHHSIISIKYIGSRAAALTPLPQSKDCAVVLWRW